MHKPKALNKIRTRRKNRARVKMFGTKEKPRLSVFRSNQASYAQLIDDEEGKTLVSSSTAEIKGVGAKEKNKNIVKAKMLGELIAERALKAGITKAMFDRGDKKYHGRVKAVAEGAREKGLKI